MLCPLSLHTILPLLLHLLLYRVHKVNIISLHNNLRIVHICVPGVVRGCAANKKPVVPLELQLFETGSQLMRSPWKPVLVGHQGPRSKGLVHIAIGCLAAPRQQLILFLFWVVLRVFYALQWAILEVPEVPVKFSEGCLVVRLTEVANARIQTSLRGSPVQTTDIAQQSVILPQKHRIILFLWILYKTLNWSTAFLNTINFLCELNYCEY